MYQAQLIENADWETFEVINDSFSKDENYLFEGKDEILKWSDLLKPNAEFSISKNSLIVDCGEKKIGFTDVADVTNLEPVLSFLVSYCGEKFEAKLYYGSDLISYDLIASADPRFSPLMKYEIILEQKISQSMEDILLSIYSGGDYKKVFEENLGDYYGYIPEEDNNNLIMYTDINGDKLTDVQLALGSLGYGYFGIIYKPNNKFEVLFDGYESLNGKIMMVRTQFIPTK